MRLFRRLYLQIYLTMVLGLVAVVVVGGGLWRLTADGPAGRRAFEVAAELAMFAIPPAEAPASDHSEALRRLHERLRIDVALYGAGRELVAASGRPLPAPDPSREHGGVIFGHGGAAWALALPDGRWLVARTRRHPPGREALGLIGFLAAMALLVALAAWPVARRLTRRLERLQSGVEQLGRGDLKARVVVEGRDEIALLAGSFNAAAGRIEALVGAHKMLLANASHEIRTPLSRIRLGLELMAQEPTPQRRAALEADIAELDALLDEVLLASRLEALERPEHSETVDLLALAAEEASRYPDIVVAGSPIETVGDSRLLRRLVRNLLDNATRHGRPPITVAVAMDGPAGTACLRVEDTGSGIPPAEREQVFEPFRRSAAARSAGAGSGLGLTLVRRIARHHGGDVRIIEPGNIFAVSLPLAASSNSTPKK